jgi:hypothetical protein
VIAADAVAVGSHAEWLAHSDHGPVTVDLRVELTPVSLEDNTIRVDANQFCGGYLRRSELV